MKENINYLYKFSLSDNKICTWGNYVSKNKQIITIAANEKKTFNQNEENFIPRNIKNDQKLWEIWFNKLSDLYLEKMITQTKVYKNMGIKR